MALAIKQHNRIHPKMFTLWLGLGSIVMMFAGLTSAFIVRKAVGNWVEFAMPSLFTLSSAVIVASSASLFMAAQAFKKNKRSLYRLMLGTTLLLGIAFMYLQWQGWEELKSYGILLNGNPSGSFVYVISGLHAAHVLGGVLVLFVVFIKSLRKHDPVKDLMSEINLNKNLGINLLSTYWHFVGILWLYLFVFLKYYQ